MPPGADLGPDGIAALIASFLEHLDLRDVTLAGNDSGGAYAQIAVARHTDRVGRLVLTSCETPYCDWPPPPFDALPVVARDDDLMPQTIEALRDPEFLSSELSFGGLTKRAIEKEALDSYALPSPEDPEIMRDVRWVVSGVSTAAVHSAARRLIDGPAPPVLLAWPVDDHVFPIDQARRYADDLADAELVELPDSLSFTPEDQPERLAAAIAGFAGGRD